VIVVLLVLTFGVQDRISAKTNRPGLRVNVTAAKWNWRFDYPAQGISQIGGDSRPTVLVVPSDTDVRFRMTSIDVIHSFWIPHVRFKRDARRSPPSACGPDVDAELEAAKQRVEDISDDLTASTTSPASVPRIFWRSVRPLPERWLYNSHVQAMSWSGHITPSPPCGWRSTGWSQPPPRTPLSAAMDLPPHGRGNRSCGISNAPSVRPPRWNHHCRAGPAWPTGSDATAPTVCCSYADASDCLNPNRTSLIG
jgi:hypothetical protein